LATPEYVDTTTRRSPTAAAMGARITVRPTTVLLGQATMPRSRTPASDSGLTSGTTRGTASSSRNRLLRSTTSAPACAATGPHSPATVGPAEKSARSTPSNTPGASRRIGAVRSPSSIVAPAVRGDPRRRSSPGGSSRSPSSRRISRPASPAAPTAATVRRSTRAPSALPTVAHQASHLAPGHALLPVRRQVRRAVPVRQDFGDGALDAIGGLRERERVTAQHGRREDRRQRIGLVLARDVRRRPVDRLEQSRT